LKGKEGGGGDSGGSTAKWPVARVAVLGCEGLLAREESP